MESAEHILGTAGLGEFWALEYVPWLRRLVAVLSSRVLSSISCWREVCDELGQVFLRVLRSSVFSIISPLLGTHKYAHATFTARKSGTWIRKQSAWSSRDVGVSDAVRRNGGCGSETRSCCNALTERHQAFRVASSEHVHTLGIFWGWVITTRHRHGNIAHAHPPLL